MTMTPEELADIAYKVFGSAGIHILKPLKELTERIAKAQDSKTARIVRAEIAKWGVVVCKGHPVQPRIPIRKHQCGVCWQKFLSNYNEVSNEDCN